MTVATMPPAASLPRRCQLSAMTAISWSPSTIAPFSSTMTTRSASPSSAMPMSARTSRTLSMSASGAVEPHLWLMLRPFGIDADLDHLGAKLPQRLGRHLVGGAVARNR